MQPADDSSSIFDESCIQEKFISSNLAQTIIREGIPSPWISIGSLHMQNSLSSIAKGWNVEVEWKESNVESAGVGCFAKEDISSGTILRKGVIGENILKFDSPDDLPPLTEATLAYFQKFMFHDQFLGMWIPGNGANHGTGDQVNCIKEFLCHDRTTDSDETSHNTAPESSDFFSEVHLVASKDIVAGEEILFSYETYDTNIPEWYKYIIEQNNLSMIVKGYNDFMEN